MRIALITYSTKPRGGVVHTLALAEAMAAAGADVTVWALGRGGDQGFFRPVAAAVDVRVVPFEARDGEDVGARILRSIDVLGAALRDPLAVPPGGAEPTGTSGAATPTGGYDVVHAQDCLSASAVALATGGARRCVRTVHHLDTFTTPALAACHERAIVEPAQLVCVSAAVAAEVAEGWGRTARVIPNGVDVARFAAAAAVSDADPGAPSGPVAPVARAARELWRRRFGRYVLAVGGIEPRKGSIDLLRAVALLRREHPNVQLVVAGGETLFDYRDYRERFDEEADALDVDPVVLGPVEHDELPALVAGAAVMGFVSTKEGFGLAAMEALAAGVPLVVRDLPVMREVFGGAALFAADPASIAAALGEALTAAGPDREERARRGRERAGGYSWDASAARHLELYAELADGGAR